MSLIALCGRRGPTRQLTVRRRGRRAGPRDDGAGPLLSFIAAAAIFALVLGLVVTYASDYQTPSDTAENVNLAGMAAGSLSLLIDGEGYPREWGTDDAAVETLQRLGLKAESQTRRIDQLKLMRFQSAGLESEVNGKVDYDEAKTALGLEGYEFHLRTFPVFDPFEDGYFGVVGMEEKRVGYIGDYANDGVTESEASRTESAVIDRFPLLFDNVTFNPSTGDFAADKFPDKKQLLETYLPLRFAGWSHTEFASGDPQGTGAYTWRVYNASDLRDVPAPDGTRVVAVGKEGTVGYGMGEDDRLVTAPLNLTRMVMPQIIVQEYVDGRCELADGICVAPGDHGTIEVSRTGEPGTWIDITPVNHVWTTGGEWSTRTIDLSSCVPCREGPVHIGFRWQSETNEGRGWLLDDVQVRDAGTAHVAWRTDSELGRSYYEVLLVGSNVDQTAMTPASIKWLLRDWVLSGGYLFVLGSTAQNDDWMQPVFGAGLSSSGNQPPHAPDPTHPILTTPNQLAFESYPRDENVWRMAPPWQPKFYQVVGTPPPKDKDRDDVLGITAPGAYDNGTVILTTYLGYQMGEDEFSKLLANFLMYGRYGVLYLDYGLAIPEGKAVGYAERLTLAPLTIDPIGPKLEMRVIIQVWRE